MNRYVNGGPGVGVKVGPEVRAITLRQLRDSICRAHARHKHRLNCSAWPCCNQCVYCTKSKTRLLQFGKSAASVVVEPQTEKMESKLV